MGFPLGADHHQLQMMMANLGVEDHQLGAWPPSPAGDGGGGPGSAAGDGGQGGHYHLQMIIVSQGDDHHLQEILKRDHHQLQVMMGEGPSSPA